MELRSSSKRHPTLSLARQSTREMSEAYYALQDLVRNQATHEEMYAGLLDNNGGTWIAEKQNVTKSRPPPLLVLMQCSQGASTWSLVTKEYDSGQYSSKVCAFIDMVKLQLSLSIKRDRVCDISSNVLLDAHIDMFSYRLTKEDIAEWFQLQSEPQPQSGIVASAKQSLQRASSYSPTGGIKPFEVKAGTVASATRSLTTAFADKANRSNDNACSKPVTPKASSDLTQTISYQSANNKPRHITFESSAKSEAMEDNQCIEQRQFDETRCAFLVDNQVSQGSDELR